MAETAGALAARVDLWRRDPARDLAGQAADAWVPAGRAWAKLVLERRTVLSEAVADTRHRARRWRLTLRARDGLSLGMRATWRGLDLMVTGIEADPATPGLITLRAEDRPGTEPD